MPDLKGWFMKVYCLLLNRSMKGLQSHFIKSFELQKTTVRVIFHKERQHETLQHPVVEQTKTTSGCINLSSKRPQKNLRQYLKTSKQ